MNIVVLVKQVPDSGAERTLKSDDWTVDRASASNVINEMDEYAIEEALRITEAQGGEVTILTVGPDSATESIRKALSMGPNGAVHVVDDAIAGSDAVQTSKVIAAALNTLEWDLVLAGAEATDGRVQVIPHMIAERLGVPALTGARKLTVDGDARTIERQTDEGYEVVQATGKAVVSVWDTINEPRYPSFKGIMAAKKKPVNSLSLGDLGIAAGEVGGANAHTTVLSAQPRPARQAGTRVPDEGEGGVKLVEFLATEKFV